MLIRLVNFFLLYLLTIGLAFGAISEDTVLEVRGGAGSDTNGGGFVSGASGTDYSQQDSSHASYTDLVIDATTDTDITSSADPFASDDVGNLINITSGTGFTTGRYEITAVVSNVATLDRAVGTTGSTGGNGTLGGALNTMNTAASFSVAGNTIYVKKATYTETISSITSAGSTNKINWIGYDASRGDNPKLTNRPVIDAESSRASCIDSSSNGNRFFNFIMKNSTSYAVEGGGFDFFNCRITNAGSVGIASDSDTHDIVLTEIDNCSGYGVGAKFTKEPDVYGSYLYIHDNGGGLNGDALSLSFCIIDTNSAHGAIQGGFGQGLLNIFNNIFFNNTNDGLRFVINPTGQVMSNIFLDNGGYGINNSTGNSDTGIFFDFNLYNNNTSGSSVNIVEGDNKITSDPSFTDDTGGDFTIGSSSSAFESAPNLGDYTNIVGSYPISLGVDQDNESGGGGGQNANGAVAGIF